jgi:restriction system protein
MRRQSPATCRDVCRDQRGEPVRALTRPLRTPTTGVYGGGVAIPDFQTLMRPVLEVLSLSSPEALPSTEIRVRVALALTVTVEDQQQLLPSGRQTTFSNRVAWALFHMSHAGLVERPARGRYAATARGRQALIDHAGRIDMSVLNSFEEYRRFRSVKRQMQQYPIVADEELSPSEAIGALMVDADQAVAADLLTRILAQPPIFLEMLAMRLLQAMGYGARESLPERKSQSGDAGLDGLVRQDPLGLDLVGMQAKRYDPDNPVNRPALQAFVGALQGAQTNRGVFVTTGRFTTGARQFAQSVAMQLILIDGNELTRLMVRYNVGVQVHETFELKQVDEEFFEEG